MDVSQDNHAAGLGGLDVTSEVPTPQPGDIRTDDSGKSDSDETSEGTLGDLDSDEFDSEEEDLVCETREGRGPLEFELRAAKAGNVHCECKTLTRS